MSTNRKAISPRIVGWGLSLQVLIALKTEFGQRTFQVLGDSIRKLLAYSVEGSRLVFGPLGDAQVWGQVMTSTLGSAGAQYVVIFAFQILPTIVFIAALFAVLYY